MDDSTLWGVVSELDRFNLLHKLQSPGIDLEGHFYNKYPIYITPLAARFVRFVQASPQNEA